MKSSSSLLLVMLTLAACKGAQRTRPHADVEDPTRCATCHTPEFASAKHPPHENARPMTCGVCHTQTAWKGWRVEHPWYVLTGAHARVAADEALAGKENQVKCFWCHRGDPSTWESTKKECIACHEGDRSKSEFPDHDTFASTCQDCHSTESWKKAKVPPAAAIEPGPPDAGAEVAGFDAGVDAGPKKVVVVKLPPKKPPPKPPDIISGPSGRHHR